MPAACRARRRWSGSMRGAPPARRSTPPRSMPPAATPCARSCPKQIEAGIDVGNNGEQQREGFFLYVQRRMSGFGGSWQRRQRGDVARYPIFQQMLQEQQAGRTAVSNFLPPKATSEVRYLDPAAVARRVRGFSERAGGGRRRLRRAVPDRTIARHRRRGDEERALRQRGGLSHGARRCAAGRVRGDRRPRFPVAAGLPGPRARAAHHLPGPAARRFPGLRRAGGQRDQPRAGPRAARSGPPARLLGQLRGPARHGRAAGGDPADHPPGATSAASSFRSPTRATPTSTAASRPRASRAGRWTTTRSWSRA